MGEGIMGDLSINFSRHEFACKCGCGFNTVDTELLKKLETIRAEFGMPVSISSGCRCEDHNRSVGGSENSQHLFGRAADFSINGVRPIEIAKFVDRMHGDKYGLGVYSMWVHFDTRSNGPARWG